MFVGYRCRVGAVYCIVTRIRSANMYALGEIIYRVPYKTFSVSVVISVILLTYVNVLRHAARNVSVKHYGNDVPNISYIEICLHPYIHIAYTFEYTIDAHTFECFRCYSHSSLVI